VGVLANHQPITDFYTQTSTHRQNNKECFVCARGWGRHAPVGRLCSSGSGGVLGPDSDMSPVANAAAATAAATASNKCVEFRRVVVVEKLGAFSAPSARRLRSPSACFSADGVLFTRTRGERLRWVPLCNAPTFELPTIGSPAAPAVVGGCCGVRSVS
jgi:hypothetical protein